jgi:di/tricarboxylate transporter
MSLSQFVVIFIIAIPLLFVTLNRLRPDVAALLIAGALGIAQFFGLGVLGSASTPTDAVKAISGWSQPVVVTLFGLFIITRALEKTGVARWIARRLITIGGDSEAWLIGLLTASTAVMSLFMNTVAAAALLLPSAMHIARQTGIKPSKLLIPVAYGSMLGGVATYFTTANIIMSDLLTATNPPQAPLHILDFTTTGGLMAIVGIVFIALFGKRLLPDRMPAAEQLVARRTGSELETMYQLGERLWEARVLPESPLVGKSLSQTDIGQRLGLAVIAVWHGRQAMFAPLPEQVIYSGDVLLIVGREERVSQLAQQGLAIGRNGSGGRISTRGVLFAEILPLPHAGAEGRTLRELEFRRKYGFTVVALLRGDRSYRTDVAEFKLQLGDSLLVVGERSQLKALQNSPDFIVLETDVSDQPVQQPQAALAVTITLSAVVMSILGLPVYMAMLLGAVAVFLLGLLTIEEAYRTLEWSPIFLIAGMYATSLAMINTGLADRFGEGVVSIVSPFGALGLAAGAYLLTGLLAQVMGSQVTALVTGPVVLSAAIRLNTSPQAIAVAAAIGCSAVFLTPFAHPVNIMMIGPGNYQFRDFFRLGWRLTLLCFVMLLVGMKLFWGL